MGTDNSEKVDYSEFAEKMVELTVRKDGTEETFQARVIAGNDLGVMYKKKSQRVSDVLDAEDIVSIKEVVSPRLRLVTQKQLKAVSDVTVKRHLADYHGWGLTELNGMSEVEATRRHDEIDHGDLGHNHTSEVTEATREEPRASREDILRRISAAGTRRSA